MQLAVPDLLTRGLSRLGLYDPMLPATYAEGAGPLRRLAVPEVPPPPAPAGLAAVLDHDETAEASAGWDLDGLGGLALTRENVEQVLDEMVRPALNADGGDIALHDIDADGNVYVKLVGSCSSCPSSVMTMRMGVERLLQEEFPSMGELVSVDGY